MYCCMFLFVILMTSHSFFFLRYRGEIHEAQMIKGDNRHELMVFVRIQRHYLLSYASDYSNEMILFGLSMSLNSQSNDSCYTDFISSKCCSKMYLYIGMYFSLNAMNISFVNRNFHPLFAVEWKIHSNSEN